MDASAAEQLRLLGGSDQGFVARQLTAHDLVEADAVLTMTRAQRTAVVRLLPQAMRRTFTLKEFARLCAVLDSAVLLIDGGVAERLRAAVAEAAEVRGFAAAPASKSDDIPDPYGAAKTQHLETAALIVEALQPVIDLFAAAGRGSIESSSIPTSN
jgi:protein-tyrosine phosphatase